MNKEIDTLLREIKDEKAWSQPRLAEEIGTSQPTVNRILNGQRGCKISTYQAIHTLHSQIFSKRKPRTI